MEQLCQACSNEHRATHFFEGLHLCDFCALLVYEATLRDDERVSSDRGATECKSSVPVGDAPNPLRSG